MMSIPAGPGQRRGEGLAAYQPSTTCGPIRPGLTMCRPPERWSSVSAAIAHAVGVRADSCSTDVPSRTREVLHSHQANGCRRQSPRPGGEDRIELAVSVAACANSP